MATFNLQNLINDFNYNGDFLDKSDLSDLLNYTNIDNYDDLISYLDDNDGNYISDNINELSDSKCDCYYYDLRAWAVDNYNYIDEAISEFGADGKDFHQLIGLGQYYAYSNEFYTLVNEFKEYIESFDFEEEEEDAE